MKRSLLVVIVVLLAGCQCDKAKKLEEQAAQYKCTVEQMDIVRKEYELCSAVSDSISRRSICLSTATIKYCDRK